MSTHLSGFGWDAAQRAWRIRGHRPCPDGPSELESDAMDFIRYCCRREQLMIMATVITVTLCSCKTVVERERSTVPSAGSAPAADAGERAKPSSLAEKDLRVRIDALPDATRGDKAEVIRYQGYPQPDSPCERLRVYSNGEARRYSTTCASASISTVTATSTTSAPTRSSSTATSAPPARPSPTTTPATSSTTESWCTPTTPGIAW